MITPLLASGGGLLEDLGINPLVLGTQMVIFAVTFLVLSRVLFGRALSHMQKREGEVRTAHETIERDRAEVARLTAEYEALLAKVDKEAYDRTQATVKEAIASAQAAVAAAQAEARAQIERGVAEVAAWKQSLRPQLQEFVRRASLQLTEKILESKLDPAKYGAVVDQFVKGRS